MGVSGAEKFPVYKKHPQKNAGVVIFMSIFTNSNL